MPFDVIVVMDPIAHIKIAKDTTFAMLLEAQRRGHRLHYVEPGGLALRGGTAVAKTAPLQVREDKNDWFSLGEFTERAFGPGQVVLMRKDPPVDGEFLYDTHVLSVAQQAGAMVVNNPQGLRDYNEKLAALLFPQCCPPTLVSREAAALKAFVAEHGDAELFGQHARPHIADALVAAGIASWSGGESEDRQLIVRGHANLLEDLHALDDLERIKSLFDDLETKRGVIDLLGRAESRLAAGQLTTPALDNADFYFRQALRLDADNAEALDGLRRVLDARIAEALELAAQRLASDQLLEPAEDSAVHYYQRVLGWLPDNQAALDGLARVSERYVELAEAAYDRREYALALEYIQQGLEAAPQYAPLLALHDAHARRVAKARAPRPVARTAASAPRTTPATTQTSQAPANPVKRLWNRIFNQ